MKSTTSRIALALAVIACLAAVSAPSASAAWPRLTVTCGPTYVWNGAAYGATNTWNPGYNIIGALWPPQTFEVDGSVWGVTMLRGFAFGAVNRVGFVNYLCLR